MNENPGGTPNPLNQSYTPGTTPNPVPSATPSPAQPTYGPQPVTYAPNRSGVSQEAISQQNIITPPQFKGSLPTNNVGGPSNLPNQMGNSSATMPMQGIPVQNAPMQGAPASNAPMQNTPIQSTPMQPSPNPMATPSEQTAGKTAAVIAPAKKKKTTITAIILLIIALICAVAAVLMFFVFGKQMNNSTASDAVPAAIQKLITGGGANNVAFSGPVVLTVDDSLGAPFSKLVMNISSERSLSLGIGRATGDAVVSMSDGTELNFSVDSITISDQTIYIKVDGIQNYLREFIKTYALIENCEDADTCEAEINAAVDEIMKSLAVIDSIDNKWIRLSQEDIAELGPIAGLAVGQNSSDSQTGCLINAAGQLGEYSNDIATIYQANPFIEYSTNDTSVASKSGQIYALDFNAEKFAGFVNSMSTTGFANNLIACTGGQATTEDISISEATKFLSDLPKIYVEINNNNDFTRVYLIKDDITENMDLVADLSFSYPDEVVVKEPSEYIEFSEVIKELSEVFSSF